MGIKLFSGSSSNPNPNPNNFEKLFEERINGCYLLVVRYPDCTNYEGNKILVFDGPPPKGELDPHFLNGSNLLARFVPTIEGFRLAKRFCTQRR